jgi:magnesium transporter
MYAILDFVGDNYFPIIDKITEELEAIEEDIFSAMPAQEKIERIYRLRAGLLNMRHAVAPMINQLRRHDFPVRTSAIKPYLRDVHDHVLLVNEAIVDLRERLTAAFEGSLLSLCRAAQRHRQKARQLGRDPRRADGDRSYLRHELQKHAGAGVAFRLSACLLLVLAICSVYYCFRRAAWL